ncbi:septum formation protein Maf [Betaproteobacteria bacterium PRO7]|jgi:septum formation protein|nr:Maf family nucleotide pyrophosphatase [Burkholderiaceae bacterium]MDL1863345.1 septum formation protein Maf [Betaproteobacteria bacterium PRO7]GIL04637.1 MAG: Maf-like protein [Betaproteobacteria bacterium]
MTRIVLASTSPYRRELLQRLRLPFDVLAPRVDEAALPAEAPRTTALRLARAKAEEVAARAADAIVIGSDQVADVGGTALSKPGSHEAALEQLERMQGRTIVFHTALAVFDAARGNALVDCVPTSVRFRRLSRVALETYLRAEQPYDCAGAAKIEGLGIALVEAVESDDPTALIGLPLIRLTAMLEELGVRVLAR